MSMIGNIELGWKRIKKTHNRGVNGGGGAARFFKIDEALDAPGRTGSPRELRRSMMRARGEGRCVACVKLRSYVSS